MKKLLLILVTITSAIAAQAADDNTVDVVFDGTTATVTIAENIANDVTCSSGTSSHVVLTSTTESVEIIYNLSGSSDDGSFTMNGIYKCEIDLNGLTLTNPAGPALNIQNGKRIAISAKKGTANTLSDGKNKDYNGCIHCTGHLEFKGKGALSIVGNSKHAIYSKEYTSLKNLTLTITGAQKDGIHCKEYFLMESGTLTISNTGDDGIQCELAGETSTGEIADDHEDEDTGNVYQLDGTLTIKDNIGSSLPVNADGEIFYRGGTQDFGTTGISSVTTTTPSAANAVYDLNGRQISTPTHGIYIQNGKKFIK